MNPPAQKNLSPLILIIAGFVVLLLITIWQQRTIGQLRTEVAALRQDVRQSVTTALEQPATASDPARRENLELIKLRPEWKPLEPLATNQYAQAITQLKNATNDHIRFLTLGQAAKMSLAVGRNDEARQFASDLLFLNEQRSRGDASKQNGDAIHQGNIVLGQLALDDGKVDEAKKHLLAAGQINGSPVLNSFGPNMALALGLLKSGEQPTVLEYLKSCRHFWQMDRGKLDEWTKDIQAGRLPDFSSSLLH